ncbi:MAG: S4 domain-containing protein [Candidatus Krumholzibacteria bacterium]|nr:S4 domain-containing protein [Candidatus Krumholzibacteria bacterium]
MRIDLLLKALCLAKTRSQAHKGCEAGCISINGKKAKPSAEVRAGDVVEIRYPARVMTVEIVEVPGAQVARKEADRFYRVVRESPLETDGIGGWDV